MNGKRLVIDASVALKWRLRDEEATSQADALLDDFLAGKLELLTPTLFDYEIANALRVAVTRQRLSEPDAATALADFAQYTIVRYDFTGIAQPHVRLVWSIPAFGIRQCLFGVGARTGRVVYHGRQTPLQCGRTRPLLGQMAG